MRIRSVAQLNRLTSSSRSAVNDSATFPPPLASTAARDGPAPIARDVLASTAPSFSTEGKSRSALRDLNGTCPVGFGASVHKAEDPTNSVGSMHPHVTVAGAGLRPWPLPPCAAVFPSSLATARLQRPRLRIHWVYALRRRRRHSEQTQPEAHYSSCTGEGASRSCQPSWPQPITFYQPLRVLIML